MRDDHVSQASGDGFQVLEETCAIFRSVEHLEFMGFTCDAATIPGEDVSADFVAEDHMMDQLVCLLVCVLRARLCSVLKECKGLPGIFALALAKTAEADKATLAWVCLCYTSFAQLIAEPSVTAFWRDIITRSPFQHQYVRLIVKCWVRVSFTRVTHFARMYMFSRSLDSGSRTSWRTWRSFFVVSRTRRRGAGNASRQCRNGSSA